MNAVKAYKRPSKMQFAGTFIPNVKPFPLKNNTLKIDANIERTTFTFKVNPWKQFYVIIRRQR